MEQTKIELTVSGQKCPECGAADLDFLPEYKSRPSIILCYSCTRYWKKVEFPPSKIENKGSTCGNCPECGAVDLDFLPECKKGPSIISCYSCASYWVHSNLTILPLPGDDDLPF